MNKIIDNKTYESSPSHFSCKGCVGWSDIELCRRDLSIPKMIAK